MRLRLRIVWMTCAFLCSGSAVAGNLWIRTFDTTAHRHDARSVVDSGDGGLVFVGYDSLALALTLVKVSSTGAIEWQRAYTYGSAWMNPRRIVRTSDGGYAVAGDVQFGSKGLFLRFDSTGALTLQRMYGSASSGFYDVDQTSDGGFILSGSTGDYDAGSGDAWIVKTDSAGNVSWSMAYGGPGSEEHARAEQTSDGGYIVSGSSESFGGGSFYLWVLKLTSSGTPVWQKLYTGSRWTQGWARQTPDGGYIVSGYAGLDYVDDVLLMRLTSTGTVSWARTYGGVGNDHGAPHPAICSDGGFLVAATTDTFGVGGEDAWLFKTDASGDLIWQKSFGGMWNESVRDGAIETDSFGAVIAGGFKPSSSTWNAFVAKTASNGAVDSSCGAVWVDTNASADPFTLVVSDTSCVVTPASLTAQAAGLIESAAAMTQGEICSTPELPDLTGSFTTLKKKGSKVNATYACVNYGTVSTGSFTVKVYLSKKTTVGPKSKVIATKVIGPLAPGGVALIKAKGAKTSKTKYIVTVLDTTAVVSETDEGNNKTVQMVP